jgi:Tfp pilus assembly protein PilN
VGLSPLGAFFAQDETPALPLSNFRTKQFSFRPRFAELLRALRETSGYVLAAVAMVVVAIGGVYGVREYNLARAKEALISELQTVVTDFPAEAEDIRAALIAAEGKISQELGVLGSPAKITPLDALIEVTRLVPDSTGLQIQSIKVSGARAELKGIAPQLSAIEDLERTLRSSKSLFSKVTATPGTASGSRFPFTIEMILAQ